MELPKVTVGVTCKNSRKTIRRCIDSLLSLNYPQNKCKIFVTDSFSNDGTYEILKEYGKKIRLEQFKSNIAGGHNFIIKNSNSEIIALTDADCLVDKNWLKELVKMFENKEIGAATGLVKTPKNVNKLQEIIGRELEARYEKFPEFVFRGPTMNLAFRTKLAKKILFDERYNVAQETEWGYRFTKHYKMVYAPKAIVYHYHRSTLLGYLKQQFRYGMFVPQIYLTRGHFNKITGDDISRFMMPVQIALFSLIILSYFISIFLNQFLMVGIILFIILVFSYLIDSIKISKNLSDIILFIILFFIRNVAWFIGVTFGVLVMLLKGR